jgi:hypothetical protein
VIEASKGGLLGAIESTVAAIPLGLTYLYAPIVYRRTPAEVNETLLTNFGLDDEYRAALRDPSYLAGKGGG